jgi:hypothetical protein
MNYEEVCYDDRLRDPKQFFRITIFNATLDIIIQQLKCQFSWLDSIVCNIAFVFLKNLALVNDANLCKQAEGFITEIIL